MGLKVKLWYKSDIGIRAKLIDAKIDIKKTQRWLNMKAVGKSILYPVEACNWGGCINLYQVDKDTFYPIIFNTEDLSNKRFLEIITAYDRVKLHNEQELKKAAEADNTKPYEPKLAQLPFVFGKVQYNIQKDTDGKEVTTQEIVTDAELTEEIINHLVSVKLLPMASDGLKMGYANNVEQVYLATAMEKSFIDKFLPLLLTIGFAIALIIIMYGGAHWFSSIPTNYHFTCDTGTTANVIIKNLSAGPPV